MKRLSLLLILLWVIPCQGRIIIVDDNGPCDFNNIQAAINDANNGDTVKLGMDDTYPFEVYHRMLDGDFQPTEQEYGSLVGREETSDMVIIMMGDRNRLELSNDQIISIR